MRPLKNLFFLIVLSCYPAFSIVEYSEAPQETKNVYFKYQVASKTFSKIIERLLTVNDRNPGWDAEDPSGQYSMTIKAYVSQCQEESVNALNQALNASSIQADYQAIIRQSFSHHWKRFSDTFSPFFSQTAGLEQYYKNLWTQGAVTEEKTSISKDLCRRTFKHQQEVSNLQAFRHHLFAPHNMTLFAFITNDQDILNFGTPQEIHLPYLNMLKSYGTNKTVHELKASIVLYNTPNVSIYDPAEQAPEAPDLYTPSIDRKKKEMSLEDFFKPHGCSATHIKQENPPYKAPVSEGEQKQLASSAQENYKAHCIEQQRQEQSVSTTATTPTATTSTCSRQASSPSSVRVPSSTPNPNDDINNNNDDDDDDDDGDDDNEEERSRSDTYQALIRQQAQDIEDLIASLRQAGLQSSEIDQLVEASLQEQERQRSLLSPSPKKQNTHTLQHLASPATITLSATDDQKAILETIQHQLDAIAKRLRANSRSFNETIMQYGSENPHAEINPTLRQQIANITDDLLKKLSIRYNEQETDILPWLQEVISRDTVPFGQDESGKDFLKTRISFIVPLFITKLDVELYQDFMKVIQQIKRVDDLYGKKYPENMGVLLSTLLEQVDSQFYYPNGGTTLTTRCGIGCKGRTFLLRNAFVSFLLDDKKK